MRKIALLALMLIVPLVLSNSTQSIKTATSEKEPTRKFEKKQDTHELLLAWIDERHEELIQAQAMEEQLLQSAQSDSDSTDSDISALPSIDFYSSTLITPIQKPLSIGPPAPTLGGPPIGTLTVINVPDAFSSGEIPDATPRPSPEPSPTPSDAQSKAVAAPTPTPAPAPAPALAPQQPQGKPVLRMGVTGQGAAVRELQSLLNNHGAKLTIDGIFGSTTDTYVRAFQNANGLRADGIVGRQTWNILGSSSANPIPAPALATPIPATPEPTPAPAPTPTPTPAPEENEAEDILLARMVHREAHSDENGSLAVAQTAVDRSASQGRTLTQVLLSPGQFKFAPSDFNCDKCIKTARDAIAGSKEIPDYVVLYFNNTSSTDNWLAPYIRHIGNNAFYGHSR